MGTLLHTSQTWYLHTITFTGQSGQKIERKKKELPKRVIRNNSIGEFNFPYAPTKINNWTVIHEQNQLWEIFKVCLGRLSSIMEQQQNKNRRVVTQEEE